MSFLSISYINGQVVSTGSITGTLAATDAQDTIAATGTVTAGSITITGTLAATEAQDVAAAVGKLAHVGSLAAAEGQDTAAFSGSLAHVGTLSATDAQDIFQAFGGGVSTIYVPPAMFIVNMGRMMSR